MNRDIRQTLIKLYATRPEIGKEVKLFKGLLEDYHHGPEVKVLRDAVELGVVERLLQQRNLVSPGQLVASLSNDLRLKFCINEIDARWAVITWALATKVISEVERAAIEEQAIPRPSASPKKYLPILFLVVVGAVCAVLYFVWYANADPIITDMVVRDNLAVNNKRVTDSGVFYYDDPGFRSVYVIASYEGAQPAKTACRVELWRDGEVHSAVNRTLQANEGRFPVVYPQKLSVGSYDVRFTLGRRAFSVPFKVLPGVRP